jgi:hypothetical protein
MSFTLITQPLCITVLTGKGRRLALTTSVVAHEPGDRPVVTLSGVAVGDRVRYRLSAGSPVTIIFSL